MYEILSVVFLFPSGIFGKSVKKADNHVPKTEQRKKAGRNPAKRNGLKTTGKLRCGIIVIHHTLHIFRAGIEIVQDGGAESVDIEKQHHVF